jgi:hypothetical protein
MIFGIFEFFFERLVAAFQFNEMIMQRHTANPYWRLLSTF